MTARLFVFELLVVVIGVLIAQSLANWAAARGERAEGERLLAQTIEQGQTFRQDLDFWHRYGPCLRNHVARISRAAARGETLTTQAIGRPALPLADDIELSGDDWRKVRSVVSDDRFSGLIALVGIEKAYHSFVSDTARQWATLRLLDGALGPPSAADRAQVRLAATIIDNNVRWMMFQSATGSVEALQQADLGVMKSSSPAKLVDSCGLIKDWN